MLSPRGRQRVFIPVVLVVLDVRSVLARAIGGDRRLLAGCRVLAAEEAAEEAARAFFVVGLHRGAHLALVLKVIEFQGGILAIGLALVNLLGALLTILNTSKGIGSSFRYFQCITFL